MAKSKARFLSELLGDTGLVKKSKSALAGADEVIDLDTIPTIPNSKLQNSSISIAGHSTALGESVTLNTGDIVEHTDYRYFTDARARGAVSVSGDLAYNSSTGVFSFTERTDAEVRGLVSATGSLSYNSTTGVMSFTMPAQNTSNVTEGTNLYFTNARADARIAAATTDDLSEGSSNLYYTDARADARVALIVDSAPGTLNTLNELAAALGDDANFSTTVTNSIAAKLPLAGGTLTGTLAMGANAITSTGTISSGAITSTGTGTAGSPTLDIINSSSSAFNHSIEVMTPNLTLAESNLLVFGKESSTKNAGYIGYKYSSAGSNDNVITLGHWGSDHLVVINGVGNTTFTGTISSGAITSNGNLTVKGSSGFNASGETASLYIGDTNSEIRATYNGGTKFFVNGTDRMELEGSTGNLNLKTGALEINGSPVITTGRALTNITSLLGVAGGIGANRASTNGSIFFTGIVDANHALWNASYGASPTTRGAAGSGFDGIYWNTYRGIHIRGGLAGAYDLIKVENSSGSLNDHTVKLYAANVERLATAATGVNVSGTLNVGTGTAGAFIIGDSANYALFKGHSNNNHMIGVRAIISGSTSSPTITGGHNTTFIEHLTPATSAYGWFFKDSYNGGATTYATVASITSVGIDTKIGGYLINGTTVIDSSRNLTLNEDLNFSTNGFADISNTGTGAIRFKPSSQTLALTLAGANATFAGTIASGAITSTGNVSLNQADGFVYLNNQGTGNAGIYVRGITSSSTLRSHSTNNFRWEVTGSQKMELNSSGVLNAVGGYQVNGTTVLDASRNLTVSTISSGAISVGQASNSLSASFEALGTDAKVQVHYSGQSRGGIAAFSTKRVSLYTTSSTDDLVFGHSSDATSANFVQKMKLDNGTGQLTVSGPISSAEGIFGSTSGSDQGIRIISGTSTADYGRIRYYENATNRNTIHFFGRTWQSGSLTGHSTGAINLDGDYGVTFGAWHNIDAYVDGSGIHTSATRGYYVGSTSVIDSSRNLVNIGTISSGDITSSGTGTFGTARIGSSASAGWSTPSYPYIGSTGTPSFIMLHNPHIPFRADNARTGAAGRAGVRMAINANASNWWDAGLTGDQYEIYRNASSAQLFALTSAGNATFAGTLSSGAITATGSSYFGSTSSDNDQHIRGNSNVGLRIQTNGQGITSGDGMRIGLNGVHAFVWQFEALPLAFATSGVERLSIAATGGFDFKGNSLSNIGTLSSGASNLTGKVEVRQLQIARDEANAAVWFQEGNLDVNHVMWNDYYGGPATRGSAGSGLDGIRWNAYRGMDIRGGTGGSYKIIEAINVASNQNNHSVVLYNANVGRLYTQNEGAYVNGAFYASASATETSSYSTSYSHVLRNEDSINSTNGGGILFQNDRGNHSWGTVATFRINTASDSDNPSIVFSSAAEGTNTWSVGFGYVDSSFRINRDHGFLNGGWGTAMMTLDRSGNATFAGNVTAYSDKRLKKNIKTIPNAIETVRQIRGVTFDWKETGESSMGVIAQEIEAVPALQCLVRETPKDGASAFAQKNVAYGNMVGLLIEAIKEQQQQIDNLKQTIKEIKNGDD